MIVLKSRLEIDKMSDSGKVSAAAMQAVIDAVRPGITTAHLDKIAYKEITSRGAMPSFLNYRGYPGSICVSVNDEVVHGIPGQRKLQEGDIVSLDLGSVLHGYHSDMARTVGVGKISPEAQQLIDVTRQSFFEALKHVAPGKRLGEASAAVQDYAESFGYGVVRDLVGHGIGQHLHEQPDVPNFAGHGKGPTLRAGMTICIEPMINAGTYEVYSLDDGWTVKTADGSLAAHYENTIAVTDYGYELLTLPKGGPA